MVIKLRERFENWTYHTYKDFFNILNTYNAIWLYEKAYLGVE